MLDTVSSSSFVKGLCTIDFPLIQCACVFFWVLRSATFIVELGTSYSYNT